MPHARLFALHDAHPTPPLSVSFVVGRHVRRFLAFSRLAPSHAYVPFAVLATTRATHDPADGGGHFKRKRPSLRLCDATAGSPHMIPQFTGRSVGPGWSIWQPHQRHAPLQQNPNQLQQYVIPQLLISSPAEHDAPLGSTAARQRR